MRGVLPPRRGRPDAGLSAFPGAGWYDSFCYPQEGREGGTRREPTTAGHAGVRLAKIGVVRMVYHRPIEGRVKTTRVERSGTGTWYVTVSCGVDDAPLAVVEPRVGIDVGLTAFATLSDGRGIADPRFLRREERALAHTQRQHATRAEGTPERRAHRKAVAPVHGRIGWRRRDFAHQHSRRIVNGCRVIAVEDPSVNRMAHNRCLPKSTHDAAWAQFAAFLTDKAASAGRRVVAVSPAYASQDCSACGHRRLMPLSEGVYRCPCCGLQIGRDLDASRNIPGLGRQALGLAPRSLRL